MSETPQFSGDQQLSTAWISLGDRCEQWACLAREAHTTGLLNAVGLAFQALYYESRAQTFYRQTSLHTPPATVLIALDRTAEALCHARRFWCDVISMLDCQVNNVLTSSSNRTLAATLLPQVWEERTRITALLLEVDRVQAQRQRDEQQRGAPSDGAAANATSTSERTENP